MTNDDKAAEALERVRHYDRRGRRWQTVLVVYGACLATVAVVVAAITLTRLGDQQSRIADNSAKGRATLKIIKDAVDPNSDIAKRNNQAVADAINRIGDQVDAITRQRDEELLNAVRSGKPIVFGPRPTLAPPPTTTTTVPLRQGPRQNLGAPPPKA